MAAAPQIALASRIAGCLLGGAVGDALGAAVEFMSLRQIVETFGPGGIRDYARAYGRKGAITDDTQMTLFTAEGLLRAHVRGSLKGICHPPSVVHHAYLRWLRTQGSTPKVAIDGGDKAPDGWLAQQQELWSRRAPGYTCLKALERTETLGAKATNDSKGCGTVMRVAPVGIACRVSAEAAPWSSFAMGVEVSQLTHGHPTGYLAGGFFAQLVSHLLDGLPLREAIAGASAPLRAHEDGYELLTAVNGAIELANEGPATPERVESLGGGWVAEEAVAIALYLALGARDGADFESALCLSVNHGGDSDSTGSLLGNLLGALWGQESIPKRWLEALELRPVIEQVARDLVNLRTGAFDPVAESARYPGW